MKAAATFAFLLRTQVPQEFCHSLKSRALEEGWGPCPTDSGLLSKAKATGCPAQRREAVSLHGAVHFFPSLVSEPPPNTHTPLQLACAGLG